MFYTIIHYIGYECVYQHLLEGDQREKIRRYLNVILCLTNTDYCFSLNTFPFL
jgi:hypothetical protein